MPKKTFTTVTPLPAGVSREIVLQTLQDHLEMIDLNPAHCSRFRILTPNTATPEEFHCAWYRITDRITMCPGFPQKTISFNACFHDLANGSQIHCYAPMGLDIKQKWTVGGNAPGEPIQPTEIGIGAPVTGLYIREDVELKCNFLAAKFVRRTLKSALKVLVARLLVKAQLLEAAGSNQRLRIAQSAGGSGNDAYKYSEYRNSEYRVSDYRNSEYRNSEYINGEHRNSGYGYSSPPVSPTLVSPMSTRSIESRFPLHMENMTSTHYPTQGTRESENLYQIKHKYKPEFCTSPTENMIPVELP